jgi:hypothetical protein
LGQINRLLGFFEDFLRPVADHTVGNLNVYSLHRSRAGARLNFVTAEGSVLKSDKPGRVAIEADVRG